MSTSKTIIVAALLCLFCSAIVSTTAVKLRPLQIKNQELDVKKNILQAAGLLSKGDDIEENFKSITPIRIDIESGKSVELNTEDVEIQIPKSDDIAALVSMPKYPKVYLKKDSSGSVETIILPVVSKGLWSTMRGFMALATDTKTVKGFSYYSHGETPGLGGEVDNPKWKNSWIGKVLYDSSWNPKISITKTNRGTAHEVDALSGATITSDGVEKSLKFWMSSAAYGKFLSNVRQGAY